MMLGLNGVCVKSHGGTDAIGFANAINVTVSLINNSINEAIKEDYARVSFDQAETDQQVDPK
jgi:glycerol-3-phosphate acyltransferase PlsX